MLQKIKDEKNLGLHLFYSQFRTIEGEFCISFKQNGFAQFKIKNVRMIGVDIADEEDKPKFVLYKVLRLLRKRKI